MKVGSLALGVLLAGVGSLAAGLGSARPACADMIETADGKWQPMPVGEDKKPMTLGPNEEPSDEMLLLTADKKVLDATYEQVKTSFGNRPSGSVLKILLTVRTSSRWKEPFNNVSSQFWGEAAEGFNAIAEEEQGVAKQQARYYAISAFRQGSLAEAAMATIDKLLAEFPKAYYFAEAHFARAYILRATDEAAAAKALDTVKNAPGMNLRDLFSTEYLRINLFLESHQKWDEAATAYRALIERVDREEPQQGALPRQQALVGYGNCLRVLKKTKEARDAFQRATESSNEDVLAGAFAGLGDIAQGEGIALRDDKKRPEAQAKLEEAVLHYLRVTVMYKDADATPVMSATRNQAQVFQMLFELSGGKDLEAADRAYATLRVLYDSPFTPPADRQKIARAAKELKAKRDEMAEKAAKEPKDKGAGAGK